MLRLVMDEGLLKEVVSELDETLKGALVSKVHQVNERVLVIRFFLRGEVSSLFISTHPEYSSIFLTERKFANPPRPPRFCALLRKWINGAVAREVKKLPDERIVKVELEKGGREQGRFTLVVELTGKSGNVILLDEGGVVLDAMRRYNEAASKRVVMPGVVLKPLPRPEGMKASAKSLEKKDGESWSEFAEALYLKSAEDSLAVAEANEAKRALAGALKRARRKLKNLDGDRERAEAELDCAKFGELILASYAEVRRGASVAELTDYYAEPPARVEVKLDPALTPDENAERYFKKTRKAKTTLKLLKTRLPECAFEIENLERLKEELDARHITPGRVIEELRSRGYIKDDSSERESKRAKATLLRRFLSSDGFLILCGKSGRGNDVLVREHAAAGDVWLHAKDVAGSHVLVKSKGRTKRPSDKAIGEAASIAALYSKAKRSGKVEVIYTDAKNVKKPKGSRAGSVTVGEYSSIKAEAGLERVKEL